MTALLCRGAQAVLAGLLLAGCLGAPKDLPTPHELDAAARAQEGEYVIGPSDVLQITVWKQPELSVDSVVVRPDGKISVPLLDDVVAAELTPNQLKEKLTAQLADFITAPTVTVVVRSINSRRVFVIGEVAREGAVPLVKGMRVVDALSVAGGLNPFAGKAHIKVIRDDGTEGPVEFRFDYEAFEQGRDFSQNILLLPGDRIVVPEQPPFWR